MAGLVAGARVCTRWPMGIVTCRVSVTRQGEAQPDSAGRLNTMKLNKTQTALQELGIEFHVYVDRHEGDDDTRVTQSCGKCGGHGRISEYANVEGGRCFECQGQGSWQVTVGTLRRRHRDLINRQNRALLAQARQDQEVSEKLDAFELANPGVADQVATMADAGNVFADSLDSALRRYGSLTERQVTAFQDMVARDAQAKAERAAATPVPAGRQVVTGRVISVKWADNHYAYNGTGSWKMTVQDERGFRVFGTVPAALGGDSVKGAMVTFTGTLEQSQDDNLFGFFKRPTKASLV